MGGIFMSGNFFVLNFKKMSFYLVIIIMLIILGVVASNMKNIVIETANQKRLLPVYSVETSEKKVALTFDCAWGADDIPQIIERLNKNNVKATFFTVGDWVTKNPEAVKKLSEAGMEIRQSYFKSCACGRDVI